MAFERPKKSDLDTALSILMHDSRHRVKAEVSRIKSDAIKVGALGGNRVVVSSATAADSVHKEAMEQAQTILLDFIERIERPPAEIVGWARPHLENLNNSLLGAMPPNGFPQDHQRLTHQYGAVFQQRLDIMLRSVEIGHQKGAGFARAERMEGKEDWISAGAAARLLAPDGKDELSARIALCKRAHAGMVRSRAQRFIVAGRARDNVELPPYFWWAEGREALAQNWRTGDFDTWADNSLMSGDVRLAAGKIHLEAFNVSFMRSDVEAMTPEMVPPVTAISRALERSRGGRPKLDWWEDLWAEIARQLYEGDLSPKTQADIEHAMLQWIEDQGHTAGETSVRDRAGKLWRIIKDKN